MPMDGATNSFYASEAVMETTVAKIWPVLFLVFFGLALPARAQDANVPPATAPPDFSGVVGQFRLTSSATPTEVAVEEPVTLKVQVTGVASPQFRPRREHLRLF